MDVSDEEWDGEVIAPMVKRQKVVVGIPVASVAVAAPAERIVKEKKNRYDQSDDWWNPAIDKGKKVGKTKKGVWRRVPGFPKKTIHVSSKGWVRQWSKDQKAWERPKRGTEGTAYYLVIKVHGSTYRVHILINRAFHGAPPSEEHTTDHKHKRPDGSKRKERQDNRAVNLDWEDASGQNKNQTHTDARYADDRPLEVRSERAREGWTVGEWVWFQSQPKAAEAVGVHQVSVSAWLAGKQKCSTGWAVRWAEPYEPQHDLPATDDDPAEVWIKVDDKTWVSNRGRAWQPYRKSKTWRKFTPRATEGTDGYPKITVGSKIQRFHIVLFDAFFPGVRGDHTIDHINRDRGDARLSNLRPATRSEQNLNRTRKPKGDGNQDSKKTRIKYRRADAPDDAPWQKCNGTGELARRLTEATGKQYDQGSTSSASNGKYHGKHKYKDYVFYKI
jgi:hypothetical protein